MKRSHDEAIDEEQSKDVHGGGLFVDEDAADRVPPYDATKEGLPPCKLYTEEFIAIEEDKTKISNLLDASFKETNFRSAPIEGLQADHKRRVKDRSSEKIKVGVVGDMSSGKSSVINSLLSVGVIARQGDAGSSCTWVVNEFTSRLPNQGKSFAAEIYFFTQDQRHDIIKALVADYYRASSKDHEVSDGAKDADQACEDLAATQSVVTAFRALFNQHAEFATPNKAHDFLSTADSEDDEEVVDQLCDMSDNLMSMCFPGPCIRFEASTPQTLLLDIEAFQHTVEEHEGEPIVSPWPFVSRIVFGLDCSLLEHVTLVDLPGLSDANKTRVSNAMVHLRTCTHYMIVANIGRATDDKSIRQQLSRGFVTRGSGRCMLVLTHADAMDEASEVVISRKGQQQLEEIRTQTEELEKRRLQLSHKIRNLPKGMQKYEAIEAKEEVAKDIREAGRKYHEVRMQNRSHNVTRDMRTIYVDLTNDPVQLYVSCVGNHSYKKYMAGYAEDDPNPPALSLAGTNIPKLRQHLLLAPMEGRLNDCRTQVMTQLPIFMDSCEIYASKTHMARKEEIEKFVVGPQYLVHSMVDSVFEKLKEDFDRTVLHLFRQDEYNWTAEAQELCKEWARMESTAAHLGLLKKEGTRKGTKRTKAANWNAQLVNINSAEIRNWFSEFGPSIEAAQKAIVKEVNTMVTNMSNSIRSDPQVALMALQPFLKYAYKEKGTINQRADGPMRHLRKDIGDVTRTATSDEVNNPIVCAMITVYAATRQIKTQKGIKGSAPKRRLHAFAQAVTRHGDGVWMAAHDHLRADTFAVLDVYAKELKDVMLKFLTGIKGQFDALCADDGVEDEREVELRERLGKSTLEARRVYEEELLPKAKAFFAV